MIALGLRSLGRMLARHTETQEIFIEWLSEVKEATG